MLSKAQILDHVWHYDFGGEANVVESYVSYLRRKVDTTEPRLLHTLRGVGYVLRVPARRELEPAAAPVAAAHAAAGHARRRAAGPARRDRARCHRRRGHDASCGSYLVGQVDDDLAPALGSGLSPRGAGTASTTATARRTIEPGGHEYFVATSTTDGSRRARRSDEHADARPGPPS